MAKTPSHELGEKIGNFFENVMKEPIKTLCEKHSVYFDYCGKRAARSTKKVTWEDINGSKHDLDYVIERNGDYNNLGNPIAFIELAMILFHQTKMKLMPLCHHLSLQLNDVLIIFSFCHYMGKKQSLEILMMSYPEKS